MEFAPAPLEHMMRGHLIFVVRFLALVDKPSTIFSTFILKRHVSRDVLQASNWTFKLLVMIAISYTRPSATVAKK